LVDYRHNDVGDVPPSSLIALFWSGNLCPRKVVGLVGPGPCRVQRYLWYQCSDEAPACVEETVAREERFCFVLVGQRMQMHKKCKIDSFVKY